MNRSAQHRLILAALAVAVLLIAVVGLPGGVSQSAGQPTAQAAATLAPRPHPISHLSFPAGIDLLNPRPHPESHLSR